jgi:hypothetical protein
MEDVRREQLRLNYALRHSEHLLERDRKRVGEVLTPDYWAAVLVRKAADLIETATGAIASRIRRSVSGWSIVDSLLRNPGWLGRLFCPGYTVEEDFDSAPDSDSADDEQL